MRPSVTQLQRDLWKSFKNKSSVGAFMHAPDFGNGFSWPVAVSDLVLCQRPQPSSLHVLALWCRRLPGGFGEEEAAQQLAWHWGDRAATPPFAWR